MFHVNYPVYCLVNDLTGNQRHWLKNGFRRYMYVEIAYFMMVFVKDSFQEQTKKH